MNSGYKYNISINVVPVIEHNLDLDYIDLIIFDFIKDFANSDNCTKIQTNEGLYFWISHTTIMNQLPLLKITSKAGIIKRIDNLINAGILEKSKQSQEFGKSLYRFGKNYDKMIFSGHNPKKSGLNESLEGSKQKFRGGLNESLEGSKQKFRGGLNESLEGSKQKFRGGLNESLEGSKQKFRGGLNESLEDNINNVYNNNNYNKNIKEEIEEENEELKELHQSEFFKKLTDYFSQNTEHLKMKVFGFLVARINNGEFEEFKRQTLAYMEYKRLSKETIHRWSGYSADWKQENWIDKLNKIKTQPNATQETKKIYKVL